MQITQAKYRYIPSKVWEGSLIRFTKNIRTQSGVEFYAGELGVITRKYRGFAIRASGRRRITRVPIEYIELLTNAYEKEISIEEPSGTQRLSKRESAQCSTTPNANN